MTKRMKAATTAFTMLSCALAHASDSRGGAQDGSGFNREYRVVVFNVFCRYQHKCYSMARFPKLVTARGEEVEDNSDWPRNPEFEVECNGETIYNSGARRFTDRDGTRIQAESGPYPATILPQRALRDGRRRVYSTLELRDETLEGSCYLYTGNP